METGTDLNERRQRLADAVACLEAGQWRGAEVACRPLLARDGGDIAAMLLTGLALAALTETAEAAVLLDRVARARADHAHPCRDFVSLRPAPAITAMAALFRACLTYSPTDARLRQDFAGFLLDQGEPAEALAVLLEAADGPATRNLSGMALAELGRYGDASAAFRQAVALDPAPSVGWCNLGLVLKVQGRFDEAVAAYEAAVERSPQDAQIRVNRAVALLQAGRWTEAWREYEWRLRLPNHTSLPLARLLPTVDALGDLRGVTVLAQHEEGFGDTLQFMRYLPLLAGRGARVVAMVPAPLARVVRSVAGVAEVVASEAVPPYHYHCPFFSLPRAFGSTVESVPNAPYLAADPDLSAAWRERLPRDGLRVGLVWAGQARPWLAGFVGLDARRSAGLAAFALLAKVAAARFVSLQAGAPGRQAQDPPAGMRLWDVMAEVGDFADTAAIVDNLDVVVSVDTAVVHLAGAMGKPVFLLDRYDNCWRWLRGRTDSPWYPNLTIFRQERPGDWVGPMTQVAAALRAMAAARGLDVPAAPEMVGTAD